MASIRAIDRYIRVAKRFGLRAHRGLLCFWSCGWSVWGRVELRRASDVQSCVGFLPLLPVRAVGALRDLLDRRVNCDPLLMGIVNVTPDSFFDGARYIDTDSARRRIDELIDEGASVIDIGAESTRPGSMPVAPREQIRRASDAIRYAVDRGIAVSVDTSDPSVAREAAELGASVVNDVSCLRDGDELVRVVAGSGLDLIVTHSRSPMLGGRGSNCADCAYEDLVVDVQREWRVASELAMRVGMSTDSVLFDPGLGFNKSARHSMEIIARLHEFKALGHAVVVGPSRKSFLASSVDSGPSRRLGGTIAACLACVAGGASILRVHDVLEVKQSLAVARDIASVSQTAIGIGSGIGTALGGLGSRMARRSP